MTALVDEGAFAFDNPMARYGAKLTPERPTGNADERRVVADQRPRALISLDVSR
jgi:hypothetical protein